MFLTFILTLCVIIGYVFLAFFAIGLVYEYIKEIVRAFKGEESSSGYPSEINRDLFF